MRSNIPLDRDDLTLWQNNPRYGGDWAVVLYPKRENGRYRYDVRFAGEVILTGSNMPYFDAARWLLARGLGDGIGPKWLVGLDGQTGQPRMRVKIKIAAKKGVIEEASGRVRVVKYRPFDRSNLPPRTTPGGAGEDL